MRQEGNLAVAASLHNTPFEDKTAYEPTGFAVDILDELSQELGLECEFTASKRLDALADCLGSDGDADVVVSTRSASHVAGSDNLLATDSYLDCKLALAVNKKDSYSNLADLEDATIGVVTDTLAQDYVQERIEDGLTAKIATYDTVAEALSDLQAKNIEGVVADDAALSYYTRVMYYREHVVQTFDDASESCSLYVSSDNPKLAAAINEALAKLKESGRYQEIYDTWFNVDETSSNPDDVRIPPQDQAGFVKGAN